MEERKSRLSSMVWRRSQQYFCVRLIPQNSMFSNFCHVLKTLILSQLEASQERQTVILKKLSEQFGNHADVINNQSKQINALYQIHQRDYKKLLQLIQLYSELSACGVMDSKRKENLKTKISNLINT